MAVPGATEEGFKAYFAEELKRRRADSAISRIEGAKARVRGAVSSIF
jgi:hypothetical protein